MACRNLYGVVAAASAFSWLMAPVVARAEPASASVHVVEPGETLSQIADNLGVDSAALARLNSLDDLNFLVVGQSLKIPTRAGAAAPPSAPAPPPPLAAAPSTSAPAPASAGATPSGAPPPSSSPRTVTIADGDTLWGLAQQFSTSTAALVDANKLDDPDHLIAGAQLVVPAGATAGSGGGQANVASSSAPVAKRTLLVPYIVQPGETLSQIAHQFDVRPDAIAQASGLDDPNRLSIGAVLKVPLPGHEHQVQAGETLRDIAAQEKVDLGSLIDFNTLDDPELIRVGQVLMVPTPPNLVAATANASSTAAKPAPPAPAPPATTPPAPTAPASGTPQTSSSAAAPTQRGGGAAAAAPTAAQGAKPVAPQVVVPPPRGAPTDGLAGAGLKLLGTPYVWGGSSPSGFDCSGFVWYAARQAGKSISRGMLGEFNSGAHPGRDELKPGDLVFFQNTYSAGLSHNGIYIGNNQFVHAADEVAGVTLSSLGTAYWSSHWFGATRLP